MVSKNIIFLYATIIILVKLTCMVSSKSIIIANYHNVLMYFPREYGGNDDLRVIFDIRNVTFGTFKYIPVVVDVAYDSLLNNAYCYLESAVSSYILLLKWAGGAWCYQVLFEFPASQFSKYMYHSVILMDDFLYWTTDRYIMSGRAAGYEKRLLLQPGWNRLYSMSADYSQQLIYVSAFDYTEYAIFKCTLRLFSCQKMLITSFPVNHVFFNTFSNKLYATSMQGSYGRYLYRYEEDFNTLIPVQTVNEETSSIIFLNENFAVYTDQQSITVATDINKFNSTRKTTPKMVDPYALQYIFSFNHQINFDSYPYPYFFTDYHDLLYKNSLYLFYFYICGMDIVENDQAFIPQMDLNNNFLYINDCQTRFLASRDAYLIPAIIGGSIALILIIIGIMVCLWRAKMCQPRVERIKNRLTLIKWKRDTKQKESDTEKKAVSNLVYFTETDNNFKNIDDSELYDKDPVSLTDMDYSRYNFKSKNSLSSSSSSDDIKFKPVYSLPSSTSSTISTISNNRVKFNDFRIEHFYEKEQDLPRHSRIYDKNNNDNYNYSTSSSSDSSIQNFQTRMDKLDRKLSSYFRSNCDVKLYGTNSKNSLDIIKALEEDDESKVIV
ncbi:unnamed protein product [Brachionus calyciflorus]|uniref:Uncharacterized protein n=1 Tax=Brachionus calyciflorus TaxID=104777 RepID=A0A813XX37_9BILA|nr:unnamed protein product [Brachionus calyciflorus]